jgi:hypothetical protein
MKSTNARTFGEELSLAGEDKVHVERGDRPLREERHELAGSQRGSAAVGGEDSDACAVDHQLLDRRLLVRLPGPEFRDGALTPGAVAGTTTLEQALDPYFAK